MAIRSLGCTFVLRLPLATAGPVLAFGLSCQTA